MGLVFGAKVALRLVQIKLQMHRVVCCIAIEFVFSLRSEARVTRRHAPRGRSFVARS